MTVVRRTWQGCCAAVCLLVAACGQQGTTWIGTQLEPSAGQAGGSAGPATCVPIGPGDACTSLPARELPRLTVQNEQLLQNGQPYHLYAIARSELLWGEENHDGCNGDDHFHDVDLEAMAAWNFNSVRVGLSTSRWFGRTCDGTSYATRIDHAVAMANAHGLYAVLELHWTDLAGAAPCGADCVTGLQPMPDQESLELWRQVAARYGKNPGVLFDLFNEPAPPGDAAAAWSCWRDGGCVVTADGAPGVTYPAAGMQALFDAVRGVAPAALVVVAGPDRAGDLSGISQGYAIDGAQLLYAVHMYKGRGYDTADWLERFGALAATYPILVTELGSFDCSADETTRLLTYLDQPLPDPALRIGWGVRSWNVPGSCGYPSIIADFSGSPLGDHGQVVRDHLRSYGAAAGPVPP